MLNLKVETGANKPKSNPCLNHNFDVLSIALGKYSQLGVCGGCGTCCSACALCCL